MTKQRFTATILGAAALVLPAVAVAPAGATGSYPGETLSVAKDGPDVAGTVGRFVASGQQTDVDSYAGGFNLDVFAKDPSVDPTCAPDYYTEGTTLSNGGEMRVVVGIWQGPAASFSVPFKIQFDDRPGRVLLCAYSTWTTDTAAASELRFDVTPDGHVNPNPNPSPSPSPTVPANSKKPRVSRSGKKLTCNPGSWSANPTRYSYGWLVDGKSKKRAHGQALGVSRKLRHHKAQCSVTASNATGTSSPAVSPPYRVR